MKLIKFFTVAILLGTGFSAVAAEETLKGVVATAEFGMVLTSGNTENSTTTGKFEVSNDLEQWLHSLKFDIVSAKADGVTTAERYLFNLKTNFKMDTEQFFFAGLAYSVDKFSGFDSQTTLVAGYGRVLYDTESFKLSAEVGPGYRKSKLEAGGDESEAIVHVGAKGKYIVNDASHVAAEVTVDGGSEQTISIVDLGYVNKLNNSLALKIGFNTKKSSNVPVGIKNTDTITSVSLLYSF